MFRKLAIAIAAAGTLTGALATEYNLGLHDPVELSLFAGAGVIQGGGVSFADFLVFAISAPSTLTSTVVTLNQTPAVGILGGEYALMTAGLDNIFSTLGDNVLVSPVFAYDGSTGQTAHAVNLLAPGVYAYGVRGTTVGAGGLYALVSTITPVPEPQTLSLMLAGAGLLGFMANRRRKG